MLYSLFLVLFMLEKMGKKYLNAKRKESIWGGFETKVGVKRYALAFKIRNERNVPCAGRLD